MNLSHEYSMIGHSRATVGRWLGVAASALAGGVLSLAGYALITMTNLGWLDPRPHPYAVPLTATLFYGCGYLVFDKWLWRKKWICQILGIPDLSGKWLCKGITLDNATEQPQFQWTAELTITQSWEKIKVYQANSTSRSRSVAASIIKEDGVGFVLMYSYRNEPKPGSDMKPHIGYCELHVAQDLRSANGHYFNSGGRLSHGAMELTRA